MKKYIQKKEKRMKRLEKRKMEGIKLNRWIDCEKGRKKKEKK